MPTRFDIAANTRLSIVRGVVATEIPGESVILDPSANRYFSIDGVGHRAWELLRESTTVAEMVRTIVAEFDVDETTCERDLRALLEELLTMGLVNVDDGDA